MKKQHIILIGLSILLIVVVTLRWPRLEPDLVTVTCCEVRGDRMIVEYRMSQKFEVALWHGIRKPFRFPPGWTGIHIGNTTTLRHEKAGVVDSAYDLIRGEHYIHLIFRRGRRLIVNGNGHDLEVPAWSAPVAKSLKWLPPGEFTEYGNGVGVDILHFAESAGQQEYLLVYAGTDVRK